MEIEKTLFRVHERFLFNDSSKKLTVIGSFVFFVLAFISSAILISANHYYQDKLLCSQYYQINNQDNTTLYQISIVDQLGEVYESYIDFYVSSSKELISLPTNIVSEHNFTITNIKIPQSCYFSNFFSRNVFKASIGLESIVINDIISNFIGQDIYLKNNQTKETWVWPKSIQKAFLNSDNYFSRFIIGVIEVLKINLGLFIQSAIASLYIKMTIICAPVFILGVVECLQSCGNREIHPQMLYRAFPWIGIYMQLLENNQMRSKKHILVAFILMLVLFYFLYLSSIFIGTFLLFYKSMPKSLDENFFGFMAIMEFFSMLFFRTRISIYFLPKLIILYYMIFIFYVQYTLYGFYYLGLYITIYMCLGTTLLTLHYIEINAQNWSPQSPYTPSVDRPRCFYLPLFHFGWINDIPTIWTMFYPLYGRRYFTNIQLAFVDQNHILLNQLIQNNQNIINNNNNNNNDNNNNNNNQDLPQQVNNYLGDAQIYIPPQQQEMNNQIVAQEQELSLLNPSQHHQNEQQQIIPTGVLIGGSNYDIDQLSELRNNLIDSNQNSR